MKDDQVKFLKNQVDDYEETVLSSIAFCHFIRWNESSKQLEPDSYFFFGRRMDTSSKNRKNPNATVTPDFIVQLNDKYGIVGEVKTLPNDVNLWDEEFQQLQKYDDSLVGWKTKDEKINCADLVLLTHYRRKNVVVKYLNKKLKNKEIELHNTFAYITFVKDFRNEYFLSFEKGFGALTNKEVNKSVENIVSVPLQFIIPRYGNVTFYDAKPPLLLVMCTLWKKVFNDCPPVDIYMDGRGKKIIKFDVNVYDLTALLKEKFTYSNDHDQRQPEIPEVEWVRSALDKFEELGYAEQQKLTPDNYTIKYRRIKDEIDTFARQMLYGNRRETRVSEKMTRLATLDEFNTNT